MVLKHRQHARTLHPHRLVQKDNDECRYHNRDDHIPHPRAHTTPPARRHRSLAGILIQLRFLRLFCLHDLFPILCHLDAPTSVSPTGPAAGSRTNVVPSRAAGDQASAISLAGHPIATSVFHYPPSSVFAKMFLRFIQYSITHFRRFAYPKNSESVSATDEENTKLLF